METLANWLTELLFFCIDNCFRPLNLEKLRQFDSMATASPFPIAWVSFRIALSDPEDLQILYTTE